jgi:hypothetical protein
MASIPPNLCVPPGTSIRLTLEAITKNGRQVALVTDPDDRLLRHRDRRRADRDVAEGLLD